MKKPILSAVLSAVCALVVPLSALPQGDGKNIGVRHSTVMRIDNSTVRVAFRIEPGDRVTAPTAAW